MDLLFDTGLHRIKAGETPEFVTRNNDADGALLIQWAQRHFLEHIPTLRPKLRQWGGNASGVNMANIDNLGAIHPDTSWWHYTLGNVRKRSFSSLWSDDKDLLMRGLRQRPRAFTGLCVQSQYLDVCNGNTRVRAHQTTVDFWAEDPGCYLDDDEIGLSSPMEIDQ
jgi:radical SAM protein with 4Fe4S-binding SPASM domain